ncbi:MAG: hypothetical protein WA061_04655 [Microgenomates group bacterium]
MKKRNIAKKQKIAPKQINYRLIAIGAAVVLLVVFGIVVSQLKTKGYNSRAAENTIDCNAICTTYFPNSAVSTAGKAPCTQSCEKVKAEIETGTPCKEACKKTLLGRAGVCQIACDKAGIK